MGGRGEAQKVPKSALYFEKRNHLFFCASISKQAFIMLRVGHKQGAGIKEWGKGGGGAQERGMGQVKQEADGMGWAEWQGVGGAGRAGLASATKATRGAMGLAAKGDEGDMPAVGIRASRRAGVGRCGR